MQDGQVLAGSPAAAMRSPSKPGARTPVRPARPMAAAQEVAVGSTSRQFHDLHEHGVLGGSFRPALDRAAIRTAESHGNPRAHPMCRPERSSQGAKTEIRRCLRPLLTRHVNGSGWAAPAMNHRPLNEPSNLPRSTSRRSRRQCPSSGVRMIRRPYPRQLIRISILHSRRIYSSSAINASHMPQQTP